MDSYYNENIQRRSSLIHKLILIVSLILIVYFIIDKNKEKIIIDVYEGHSVTEDPIQEDIFFKDIITLKLDNQYTCLIFPQAIYKLTVKVKSINTFHFSDPIWRKKLSKYDVGVVWGKLADEYYDDYIEYNQLDRYLIYNFTSDCNLSSEYIGTHLSNNHIIPANSNINKGLSKLKKNDICYLEGKLVNFFILKNEERITFMESSLVRTDTGDGACETFYVEKLIIGDKIYE